MPKVSVIIPSYNHARFLEQRIESVLNQTFQDFEIIFLDDNSTDNSREVFAKYANHPKITYAIFNEINSGSPFKQWNKGFSLTTGEYIWIAESDDYASPKFLQTLVNVLDQRESVGLVYCQSSLVDENNNVILSTYHQWTDSIDTARWKADYFNDGISECRNFLICKNIIPNASAVLIRKSIYQKIDKYNDRFKVAGDWLTWTQILLKSDIVFISEPLNYFRTHENNVSRGKSRLSLIVKEALIIIKYIQLYAGSDNYAKKIAFKTILNWWMGYLLMNNFSFQEELNNYFQVCSQFPEYPFLFSIHWNLIILPYRRLRYSLKIKTRFKKFSERVSKFIFSCRT